MTRNTRTYWLGALAGAVALLAVAATGLADNASLGVVPPNERAYGHTYGGWSAEWWKWFLSIPEDVHPSLGGSCQEGQ
jgi:hypothetical protein